MSLFAAFDAERPAVPRVSVDPAFLIRDAEPRDVDALAALSAARNGRPLDRAREGMRRRLDFENALLLVATIGDAFLGYAGAQVLEPPPQPDGSATPSGWYLTGLVVAPAHRRRGVGAGLTSARMERLASHDVFAFMSDANRASIVLHENLGFARVLDHFAYPGVSFTGGSGSLYRLAHRGGDAKMA